MTAVSIFGLGYVGCVSAACFAKEGHQVTGVDVSPDKVALVNAGKSTIVEEGIAELVAEMHGLGRLKATTDVRAAVATTDLSLICVGTPSRPNGSLDLQYVERVCEEIGAALKDKKTRHVVVIRSTVLPGTIHTLVTPALERTSGKKVGPDIGVASNPEFLREGTSIRDFYDPPFTLIGTDDEATAAVVRSLYAGIEAPVHHAAVRVSEMVKYACNSFHGLKVGFANEIGNVCKALGVDSHDVMRIFCEDRKLNISPYYLKPGFAFGGSCLPKDLRAIVHRGRELDVDMAILAATLTSNQAQVERAFRMVMDTGARKVGVLGLAFKAGTDDLRESPIVTLIEMLLGKGIELRIFDRNVSESRLVGANRAYIEKEIPHIWTMMRGSVDEAVDGADTVIFGNSTPEFRAVAAMLKPTQAVVDLARLQSAGQHGGRYEGICW